MSSKEKFCSRRTAIHEAGHVIAYWWNGQGIHNVTVRSQANAGDIIDRRGREQEAIGLVEAGSFVNLAFCPPELTAIIPNFSSLVERDLLHCYAGPLAEAKYRRCNRVAVLLGSGADDLQRTRALIGLLPMSEQSEAEQTAMSRVSVLLNRYWPAVEALADILQAEGQADGERVTKLLKRIMGEVPTYAGNQLDTLDR